jgi:thioredoxin reductase (NADPH)
LAKIAKKIYLVHRRDEFRGAQHTESQMRELVKSGKINLKIPYVIKDINGEDSFSGVDLMHFETKEIETIDCDEALFFFGLNKQLGPILDWEIELSEKKISVNTESFETNKKGIFAVGDINTYPGKLDLILCGFHETTLAVQEAFKRINPGERVPFGYTTSNKGLQEKLKVNKS